MTPNLSRTCSILMSFLLLSALPRAQASKPSNDDLLTARNFLWDLYPDTRGKNYSLSVEGWLHYDQPNDLFDRFELYLGEGPQFDIKRPASGCMGTPSPVQLPTPPELGPPSPVVPPTEPSPSATNLLNPDCQPGPVRYKQELSVHFEFDEGGRLLEYHILSPGFRQLEQRNKFGAYVLSHPALTYAEVVAALKTAGAKYGPDDKNQFVKDLPIQRLERYLGKLRILSVSFQPLFEDRFNASVWPRWEVKAKTMDSRHSDLFYKLSFEQFEGELISLAIEKPQ